MCITWTKEHQMKASDFTNIYDFNPLDKLTEFQNEHMTEPFLKSLKQYQSVRTNRIFQVSVEAKKYREITDAVKAPAFVPLED